MKLRRYAVATIVIAILGAQVKSDQDADLVASIPAEPVAQVLPQEQPAQTTPQPIEAEAEPEPSSWDWLWASYTKNHKALWDFVLSIAVVIGGVFALKRLNFATSLKNHNIWVASGFWCFLVAFGAWLTWDYLLFHHDKVRNLSLVAAALIGAPVVLWRTTIAHNESQIRDQEAKTRETDAQTRQQDANTNSANAVTTAYTQAMTQLGWSDSNGDPVVEGRLGAIYALEKIAINNKDYRKQIINVLTGYVRQHTNIYRCKDYSEGPYANSPREDIQGIFNVFSHDSAADWINSALLHGEYLAFERCHLTRLRFAPKGLKCSFVDANLEGANFNRAVFAPSSIFHSCSLQGAYLYNSILRDCIWSYATFKNTYFENPAHLDDADIRGSMGLTAEQLEGIDLSKTKRNRDLAPDQEFPEGNDD